MDCYKESDCHTWPNLVQSTAADITTVDTNFYRNQVLWGGWDDWDGSGGS